MADQETAACCKGCACILDYDDAGHFTDDCERCPLCCRTLGEEDL